MLFTSEWFDERNTFCCIHKKGYLIGRSTIKYILRSNFSAYLPFFINNKKVFI